MTKFESVDLIIDRLVTLIDRYMDYEFKLIDKLLDRMFKLYVVLILGYLTTPFPVIVQVQNYVFTSTQVYNIQLLVSSVN